MATAYTNPGGTGNRTASIAASTNVPTAGPFTNIVNGNTSEFNFSFTGTPSVAGKVITFDFGVGVSKIIDGFKWYQSDATAQGVWHWYGSNDGSSYTALGSNFSLTNGTFTEPAGNTTGYRYYQMQGVSGTASGLPSLFEIEFRIDAAVAPATGTLAATESADIVSCTGAIIATGTLSVSENSDIVHFIDTPTATGTLGTTEVVDSVFFSSGTSGPLTATEAPDTLAFTFDVPMGEMLLTETRDLVAIVGTFRRHTAVITIVSNT
jgi:hypothetical protein